LGFFNTVILARLLSPEDYGVVGMAFLVVGLVSTFLDTGAGSALVRIGNPNKEQINSAWTLQSLQGCVLCAVLLIASPIAVIYFKEPRVGHVLNVVAICVAFMGFSNIGMSLAYLNLKFAIEYKMQIFTKLSGAIATLIAAYYFKDYRALVTGIVVAYIAEWCLSYYLHPYRPKWDTRKISEIWGISKWLMFGAIGGYF